MKNIAVLITSYNRVEKTLECLEALYNVLLPPDICFDVYLVDDASSDETGRIAKEKFPQVNVISGTGKLYWCGGMRLAWEKAAKKKDYDYYLWLNDDTVLHRNALNILFNDFSLIKEKEQDKLFAICGACVDRDTNLISYSASNFLGKVKLVLPIGEPVECKYMNGNIVIISKELFQKIGGLSKKIIHRFGDYEYSIRIQAFGGKCFLSSNILGYCRNEKLKCFNSGISIIKRLKLLHSPVGLGIKDDLYFKKKYYNKKWFSWFFSVFRKYLMTLAPTIYERLKIVIIKK